MSGRVTYPKAAMLFRAARFFAGLLLLPAMLSCCATSDATKNTCAGVHHPLLCGHSVQEWPPPAERSKDNSLPLGLFFPAHGTPRGTFFCLHGIQTNAAWFAPLARELTAAGYDVIAVDRRGSGVNTTAPFVKGHVNNANELLTDLARQLDIAQKEHPHLPLYLVGTSWGSNVAGNYVLSNRTPQPMGLILLVPATRSRFESGFTTMLVSSLSLVTPTLKGKVPFEDTHYHPGEPHPVDPRSCEKLPPLDKPGKLDKTHLNAELTRWLDTDEKNDVLVEKPTFRLLRTGLKMASDWKTSPKKLDIPMLVIVAECDQIMDNGASCRALKRHDLSTDWEKDWVEIKGAGHGAQITHAPEIRRAIQNWLSRQPHPTDSPPS